MDLLITRYYTFWSVTKINFNWSWHPLKFIFSRRKVVNPFVHCSKLGSLFDMQIHSFWGNITIFFFHNTFVEIIWCPYVFFAFTNWRHVTKSRHGTNWPYEKYSPYEICPLTNNLCSSLLQLLPYFYLLLYTQDYSRNQKAFLLIINTT